MIIQTVTMMLMIKEIDMFNDAEFYLLQFFFFFFLMICKCIDSMRCIDFMRYIAFIRSSLVAPFNHSANDLMFTIPGS